MRGNSVAFFVARCGVLTLLCSAAAFGVAGGLKPAGSSISPNQITNPIGIDAAEKDKYWLSAKELIYRSVPDLLLQHRTELASGTIRGKLMHGDINKKQIALTFDDGPHPKFTPRILAVLKQYNVKATFFLVGEMAEKYPNLVKSEVKDGHNVGNHTYHHVSLPRIPSAYVATEIKACGVVLNNILGKPVHLFRPPGGDYDDSIAQVVDLLGYKLVLWTDDPGDYASPGVDTIVQRTLDKADNGGIILIHDGVGQTIQALPRIISTLKSRGYQFVTIDEMIAAKQACHSLSRRQSASRNQSCGRTFECSLKH